MRRAIVAFVCLVVLGMPAGARGGVYQTFELEAWPPAADFRLFKLQLQERRDGLKTQARLDALLKKKASAGWTVADRINASALYIRLGKYLEAQAVLLEAERLDRRNFMVQCNLATVQLLLGENFAQAHARLEQALADWPTLVPGFTPEQLYWYRRVERIQLGLLRSYERMQGRPLRAEDLVEGLFPGVRFDGPFRVGGISPRMHDRLPPDVVPILKQLVLWMPQDNQLYWVLGEVLNANGEVLAAAEVFTDFGLPPLRSYSNPVLLAHRRELIQARAVLEALKPEDARLLLNVVSWRCALGAPVIGSAALEINTMTIPFEGGDTVPGAPVSGGGEPQPPASPRWLPDSKSAIAGFAAGILAGMLILMQIRELRRRFSA